MHHQLEPNKMLHQQAENMPAPSYLLALRRTNRQLVESKPVQTLRVLQAQSTLVQKIQVPQVLSMPRLREQSIRMHPVVVSMPPLDQLPLLGERPQMLEPRSRKRL